jgi:Uri superfamily endonuclease
MAGGDSEKFFQAYNPNLDYSQYEIDKGDIRTQKAFVSEYFKTKGHDEEFIKDMLEDYEDSGKLYDKATIAQKQLANVQREERERLVQEQKQIQAQTAQQQQEFWENVANVIDEGKEFAGIRIPEKEKAKFFDYISAPINKNGATKRDEDYANAELEVKLAVDYLMFKGFKLNDIISTKAKTESARNLKEKLINQQERVKNYGKVDKKMTKFDPDKLDMKRLFE